ncbi:hypothetical protein LA66_00060 [Aureimonas altamirensis]|uniref:Uncharacterized protein n=1 Tax=Aureimonas altamirensis TaxID=370622 RepID=A0A0B1Q6W4_9HYPH|nr:hypothetical protein [Aureimonas altamirensis]KHJ55121.1 hypothetical protein LA66_00060 [Aureimonas altamirensis]
MGKTIDSMLREHAKPGASASPYLLAALRGGMDADQLTEALIGTAHDKQEIETEFRGVCRKLIDAGVPEHDVANLMGPAIDLGIMMAHIVILSAAVAADARPGSEPLS